MALTAVMSAFSIVSRADPPKLGVIFELAGTGRLDPAGIGPGFVTGLTWSGVPTSAWLEIGSFDVPAGTEFGTSAFAYFISNWDRVAPRLHAADHRRRSIQEVSAGVLLGPKIEHLHPFVRAGVGYYLDELPDYEAVVLLPDPSPATFEVRNTLRQWQAGATLGFGIRGDIDRFPASPIVEIRWQTTRLPKSSGSCLLGIHVGMLLGPS